MSLIPRTHVPALSVPTLAHGLFSTETERPAHFTMIVFYRGAHRPICVSQLKDLGALLPDFEKAGINVIAISSDTQERAQFIADKVSKPNLRIGYKMPLTVASKWGLYISQGKPPGSASMDEPTLFSEPGLFAIRPDQTLYFSSVQTMPFARPSFKEVLSAFEFVINKNYPARGEFAGELV